MSISQIYYLIKSNQKRIKKYEDMIANSKQEYLIKVYKEKVEQLLKENEELKLLL